MRKDPKLLALDDAQPIMNTNGIQPTVTPQWLIDAIIEADLEGIMLDD